jgi:signal transduction histidine kinase
VSTPLTVNQQLERIAAVNQHLRRALDQVSEGVLILESEPLQDAGPKIIYANEAAIALIGREVGRLIGAQLGCFLERTALGPFLLGLARETQGKTWQTEAPLVMEDGQTRPARWQISAARDQAGAVLNYTTTFRLEAVTPSDPTNEATPISVLNPSIDPDPRNVPAPDQYQADQVANIRETSRRVAHEFNNALTAILMPVGVAARLAPPGSDLLEKLILAQRSAEKAAGLAKDFLECFRPREAVKERTCLKDLLSRTLRLATVAEQVECQLSFSDDLLPILADPEQIDRVFFNLIRNACDAMQQKGRLLIRAMNVTVGPAEEASTTRLAPGSYVRVIVRDYGPGIQPEHMQHLFHQRFTTKPHGNGCGLPICYQIVQEHGGAMYVSSKVNVGTAFDIFLPAAGIPEPLPNEPTVPYEPVPSAESQATPVPPVPVYSPSSLLIVEDDDIIRSVTGDITRQLGWEVESAAAGDEALNILRTRQREDRPIKAVLLDMNLAGPYSGLQTFERMQLMDADIRVIATSGDHQDVESYRRLGFATFLPKPYSWESLQKTLNDALSS